MVWRKPETKDEGIQAVPPWTLQPNIQSVFNPIASLPSQDPGITMISKNALVIGVRTKIDF